MKKHHKSLLVMIMCLFCASSKQNLNTINNLENFLYHNLGIIIHPLFPGDPEPSYPPIILDNAEPYDMEDTATIGNQILSLAREFDSNSTHLSSCPSFDLENDEYSVLTDANTFIDVFEDDDYSTLTQKMSRLKSISVSTELETFTKLPYINMFNGGSNINEPINLHILVPGINGDATHWSNNGKAEGSLYYLQANSIPAKLSQKYASQVYIISHASNNSFVLYQYNRNAQRRSISNFNPSTYSFGDNDVILYEDNENCDGYNNDFYNPFSYLLNQLYLNMNGGKFNLYGHSRGGLINLMYATYYSQKINRMFSFGTPYYPPQLSEMYTIINSLPECPTLSLIKTFINYCDLPYLDAYSDLSNVSLMDSYRTNWNSLNHNNIDFRTYGYDVTYTFETYIPILFWTVKIQHVVRLGFDGLVGEGNARGFHTNYSYAGFANGLGVPIYTENINFTSNYLITSSNKRIDFPLNYILSIMNDPELNGFKKSSPYDFAIPHNLELMYKETIDDVISQL